MLTRECRFGEPPENVPLIVSSGMGKLNKALIYEFGDVKSGKLSISRKAQVPLAHILGLNHEKSPDLTILVDGAV